MISKAEYEAHIEQIKSSQAIINAYHLQEDEAFAQRLKDNPIFTDDELRYAAYTRCPCGHGLAYPKNCGPRHYWDCSAILKGIADHNLKHTDRLPFTFYEVKSEDQPSAQGATTRTPIEPLQA